MGGDGWDVPAIFVNLTEPLAVARRMPMPLDVLEAIGEEAGDIVVAQPVSLAPIRNDFPNLPVWSYRDGRLQEIAAPLQDDA